MSKSAIEKVVIPECIGRKLECKCGYSWVYLGKSDLFASCPRCRSTVTLRPKRKMVKK